LGIPPSFQDHYDYILENIRDILFILDSDGKIHSITREFEKATGYSRTKWIGKHFLDLVHPEDAAIAIQGFERTISGETPDPYKVRVKSKSGEFLIFEAKATPHIVNGEIVGYLGIARDITAKWRVEEALKASEQHYRRIIDSITDPIQVINKELIIIFLNPAFVTWLESLGLDSNIKNKSILEAFPFLGKKIIEEYNQVFTSAKVLITLEDTTIDGKTYLTETLKIPMINQGKVVQVLTIIRDITKRETMEQQFYESEEKLRSFMDAATDSFSLWDSELNLLDINQSALDIYGIGTTKEKILGKNMLDFVSNPKNTEIYKNVLKTGIPITLERIAPPRRFGNRIFSVKAFKVADGLGLITTDITKQKKMEDELKENEEKFRSIFENAPIGMALTDLDFELIQVNDAFCQMLGYPKSDLTQMSIFDIKHPDQKRKNNSFLEKMKKQSISLYNTEMKFIKNLKNTPVWARTTIVTLHNEVNVPIYHLFICEDITAEKDKEAEIKRQLLNYSTEDGNVYLIKERTPVQSFNAFKDLIKIGYDGYIISRNEKNDYNEIVEENVKTIHLNEKNSSSEVLKAIAKIMDKSVLLFDRLEYIFLTEGFENGIQFIYELSDIIKLNDLIAILSVDCATFTEREVNILEKETKKIEPRFITTVAEELRKVLHYIYQQNSTGIKPSYSEVGRSLQISRPTARKRIKRLVITGYIVEQIIGKSKILEISSKGRSLLQK